MQKLRNLLKVALDLAVLSLPLLVRLKLLQNQQFSLLRCYLRKLLAPYSWGSELRPSNPGDPLWLPHLCFMMVAGTEDTHTRVFSHVAYGLGWNVKSGHLRLRLIRLIINTGFNHKPTIVIIILTLSSSSEAPYLYPDPKGGREDKGRETTAATPSLFESFEY